MVLNSLYTNEIRYYLRTRPWPKNLVWEIVEKEDCLKFRMYRDNLNKLEADEKIFLTGLLNETLGNISKGGVPIFIWVAKGDGNGI